RFPGGAFITQLVRRYRPDCRPLGLSTFGICGAVVMSIGFIVSLVWLRGDLPATTNQKGVDQATLS
ncbi:MAG: hypothetical protein MUO57_11020, partial [Anaerolineales bacterium]|nr:hypothetical protein [Anaerolineales bacterium]